ncbi:GNAT family protein [Actinoplanes sp. NPDC051851]|uniref:GNAT family N-acetyltransferase n=1 Tax=Actinoplanes sp. NPDC051851 TaxID=3154753 RepID=UPI0034318617
MSRPTYPIHTARLALRPVTPADLDDVHAFQSHPEVARWALGGEPRARSLTEASVTAMAGEDALHAEGDCLTLAAVSAGTVIGTVELVWRSESDQTAELGYVFHPGHGGRGLATEAAAALLDWGFGEFGLHRVYARCHARNEPSARLMTRLGMRREAHHVAAYRFRGEWTDQLVFAVLSHEWHALRRQPPGHPSDHQPASPGQR